MPTQEDKNKPQVEKPEGPETPEQTAARAVGVVQEGKEQAAAVALAGAETEAPTAEHGEQDPAAKAREIAQKYLDTIPEADRKLTDPKQVEKVLSVLMDAEDPMSHLFAVLDKFANPPERVATARNNEAGAGPDFPDFKGMAKGWRDFAADPVGIAMETDKVASIAKSSLPESVRNALLLIILKEGDHSAVDMAIEVAEKLERATEGGEWPQAPEVYRDMNKQTPSKALRQKATLELLNGLYPELMQNDGVELFLDIKRMPFEQRGNKEAVVAMVERYNQVFGGETVFAKQIGGASNGTELFTRLKDGSIMDGDIKAVQSLLDRAIKVDIAKKATSAEAKQS